MDRGRERSEAGDEQAACLQLDNRRRFWIVGHGRLGRLRGGSGVGGFGGGAWLGRL